jgi:hypothetical protein
LSNNSEGYAACLGLRKIQTKKPGLHLGQEVTGSGIPYVVHLAMVAMEVIAALQGEDGLDGDLAVQIS